MNAYITIEQLDAAGVTYDTAIPQALFDEILHATGQHVCGNFVFVYQPGEMLGRLLPVTQAGAMILDHWNQKRKSTCI